MFNIILGLLGIIVVYAVFFQVPEAVGLGKYVRIAFFHIPVAWVSVLAFITSAIYAIKYLKGHKLKDDMRSYKACLLGFFFCIWATVSGAVFAKLTWGAYWNWDPRETSIFVLLLIYAAYLTLRQGNIEPTRKAKISSIYTLLSTVVIPFLVFVLPRIYFSLHPEPLINASGKIEMDTIMIWTLMGSLLFFTLLFFKLLYKKNYLVKEIQE